MTDSRRSSDSPAYAHLAHELWTPITPEIVALLEQCKKESGMSWNLLARHLGIRERVIRRYRTSHVNPEAKKRSRRRVAIPMGHLDRVLAFTNMNHRLEDFEWFTTDELVERGVWMSTEDVKEARRARKISGT